MLLAQLFDRGGVLSALTVPEKNGSYDLTGIDGTEKVLFLLPPGAFYYPNLYLTPEAAAAATPESTEHFGESRTNYLTQRFILEVPNKAEGYALTLHLSGRHAIRVYVNGVLAAQAGQLGTTKQDTDVWEEQLRFYAAPQEGKLDIIVQSARFYHARGGALLASITVERAVNTVLPTLTKPIVGFVVMGALLCAAMLLLGSYLFLSHTKVTLYFAFACLTMALREWIQSQAWTYFPISGNLIAMLEYMSVVLLTIFLSLYLLRYATSRFLKITFTASIGGSLVYGLMLLLTDSLFYTKILVLYQLLLIVVIVPGVTYFFGSIRRPNREQAAVMYGISVFYIAAVADILLSNHLFGSGSFTCSETAMLIFVLAQTVSLFQMNNRILSEARAAEQKLEAENAALENLNRLKTEFLSNVSHELKTPLTVVSGYAQLIGTQLSTPKYASARDKSRIISSEADRLALMVSQILDVTRIEENRMLIEKRPCHIDELINNAVAPHFPILNKGGNRLEIDVSLDLPMVEADPGRITQVLVNLIANALRHTDQGLITVSASAVEGFVQLSVSDTGKGISEDELRGLFTRFRAGSGETGTGLGLYICKYLVEEHGGTIQVESAVNQGTTVTFSLPL